MTAASADLKLFRRGALPGEAQVRRFDEFATQSNSRFGDLRARIWNEDSRSPWDQVVQDLFKLDGANMVLDNRLRAWATLEDNSRSLFRCETDQTPVDSVTCKGTDYQSFPAIADCVKLVRLRQCRKFVVIISVDGAVALIPSLVYTPAMGLT